MKRYFGILVALLASLLLGTPGDAQYDLVPRVRRSAANVFSTTLSTNDSAVARIDYEVDLPWENFIAPSPTIVALLGQLMVISGRVDVDLRPYAPQGGFKQMRYPNSFRASLVQVSNDAWSAFNVAHRNMDKIQLYMTQIPDQVKTVFKIFALQSPILVQNFLPSTLTKIQDISQHCVEVSAETVTSFTNVMALLGELLEATESGRGGYENQLAQVQIDLNVSLSQKEYFEKIGDEIKNEKRKIEEEVNKLRREYDDAFKKIPTGWDAMLQRLANVPVSFLENVFGDGDSNGGGGSATGLQKFANFAKSVIFGVINQLFDGNADMKTKVQKIFQGQFASSGGGPQATLFNAYGIVLNGFERQLSNYAQEEMAAQAFNFINKAKSINQNLESLFSDALNLDNMNSSTENTIMAEFDSFQNQMKEIVAQSGKFQGGLATTGQNQQDSAGSNPNFRGVGGAERYKAQIKLGQLQQAEKRYDQYFGELMKFHEEMKTLMGKIARLQLQEVNFKEILELLKEGIRLLSKIRAQWGKLIEFFQIIATRAEVTMNGYLIPEFTKYATIGGGTLRTFGPVEKAFFFGKLKEQAVEINKAAFYLYTLSSTYYEVSSRYLMSPLAGLSQMLTLSDENERKQKLLQLEREAGQTTDVIKDMARQRRINYRSLVEAKKREFQDVITKMGGVSEEDMRLIEEAGLGSGL